MFVIKIKFFLFPSQQKEKQAGKATWKWNPNEMEKDMRSWLWVLHSISEIRRNPTDYKIYTWTWEQRMCWLSENEKKKIHKVQKQKIMWDQ